MPRENSIHRDPIRDLKILQYSSIVQLFPFNSINQIHPFRLRVAMAATIWGKSEHAISKVVLPAPKNDMSYLLRRKQFFQTCFQVSRFTFMHE